MFKHKKYAFVFIVISLPMVFIVLYGWIKKENHPIHELVKQETTRERTALGEERITSLFTTSLDSLQQLINITRQYKKEGYAPIELVAFLDSIYIAKKLIPLKFYLIPDSNIISKSYLKKNEELATRSIAEAPWKNLISSEVFEEYIFPYKLDHEIVDNWREELFNFNRTLISSNPQFDNPDSLYRYHMQNTYYSLKSENSINQFYPVEKNYTWLNISQEGDCSDRCRYVIYHLRAAGVPATYDYIPNWGNRPKSRHAYVGLAHKRQQPINLLENRNDTGNLVENLNAANIARFKPIFAKGEVPDELTVQYEKTIPKVYRQTWSN